MHLQGATESERSLVAAVVQAAAAALVVSSSSSLLQGLKQRRSWRYVGVVFAVLSLVDVAETSSGTLPVWTRVALHRKKQTRSVIS